MKADYTKIFSHADDVIEHLNRVVPEIPDPLLVQKYVGFVSVVAVTVYELAIKNIFIGFAKKQQRVFGNFVEASFDRINGRIRLKNIRKEYLAKFGEEYRLQFEKSIEKKVVEKSAYGNVIAARNQFVHAGNIQSNSTYKELVEAYEDGKEIIHCLAETMTRRK